jgi:hypothetical protein
MKSKIAKPVACFTSEAQRKEMKAVLNKKGIVPTVDTFVANISGKWYFQFHSTKGIGGPKYDLSLTGFSGDVIDLGKKSWIVVGTATGHRSDGRPLNMSFNIEYDSALDSLNWNLSDLKAVIAGVSNPNSPVQMRADISVPKLALIVRQRVEFQHFYRLLDSSYLSV